jgi:CRP-like cAMP-binding protein
MSEKRVFAVHPPSDARPQNQLLAALPATTFRRLRPFLETVPIRVTQVLHTRGKRIDAVYFLNGGVASITTTLSDGTRMDVATVGHEGLLGIEAFHRADAVALGDTVVRVPDTSAERLDVRHFRHELAKSGAFHELIGHYAHVFLAQTMQTSVCNARHQVQQRCAHWLLMTDDRMRTHNFILTHAGLAVMLGAGRPSVSAVAARLQKAGLILSMHGRMTVLDHKRLERVSCECYATIRAHFRRLQP